MTEAFRLLNRGLVDRKALGSMDGLDFILSQIVNAIASLEDRLAGGTSDMGQPVELLQPTIGGATTLGGLDDVTLVGPVEGHALVFNGLTWGNLAISTSLEGLTDTTITEPESGNFLRYDGAAWVNQPFSLALNDLTDVNAPSPSTGHYLKWTGSQWVPASVATQSSAEDIIDSLEDIDGEPSEENPLGWVRMLVCVNGVDVEMDVVARYVEPTP